uniref:Uncharacterized protein n=1 Tax=Sorangium cellulosum TaxID=56 RepID=A0A3S7V040_SORCE|nr:hypothetical protein [Sorangium cellulosum]
MSTQGRSRSWGLTSPKHSDFLLPRISLAPLGVVIAMTFAGLPFVVRTVQPVIEDLSRDVEEAAATLGASRTHHLYQPWGSSAMQATTVTRRRPIEVAEAQSRPQQRERFASISAASAESSTPSRVVASERARNELDCLATFPQAESNVSSGSATSYRNSRCASESSPAGGPAASADHSSA